MWELLKAYFPNAATIICTILVFAVPYTTFKINQTLHNYGDPVWKKDENEKEN